MSNSDKTSLEKLEEHVFSTYIGLRMALVLISIALPIGLALFGKELQPSISAYYDTALRNLFVGFLFAVGVCLYLYKGFTDRENIVLNVAGALALGVAIFPHTWEPFGFVTPHGICAVLFFAGVAWVCWRCAGDTLVLLGADHEPLKRKYERQYRGIAIALALSPLLAVAYNFLIGGGILVFLIETFAIWVFAYYWGKKGEELIQTRVLQRAIQLDPELEPLAETLDIR